MKPIAGADYSKIWVGNAASNLSDGLTFVAMPLIAAALSNDPLAVAGLTVAYSVPRIIILLGIGVLIDRVDRRRLLAVTNALRCGAFLVLVVALVTGAISLPMLYIVYGTIGLIETTSDTAVFTVLPVAVAPSTLDRANSQIAGTQLVLDEFIGPPLGGFLFAVTACLPIGAASFACCIAALSFMLLRGDYRRPAAEHPRASIRNEIQDSVAWLRQSEIVFGLVIIAGISSLAYSLPFSYLVLFARQKLGLDASGYGLLMSFSALGGLCGSLFSQRLRRKVGYGWGIVLALCLGSISIAACGLTRHAVQAGLLLAAYICHAVVWNVLATTVRQKIVPVEMLGRVGSVWRLLSCVGIALGAALGGWLASAAGLRLPFLISGVLFLACAAVGVRLCRPLREWEREGRGALAS